jgi:hypothetical protein
MTAANLADVTGRKQASSQEAFEGIARTLMPLRGTPACLVAKPQRDDSDCSP